MRLQYKTRNNRITVEIEADTVKQLVAELAKVQEVFEEANGCQMPGCGCTDTRFVVRTVGKFTYNELRCTKCRARLAFGVTEVGEELRLFPKRKAKLTDKNYLPNQGWRLYDPNEKEEEE